MKRATFGQPATLMGAYELALEVFSDVCDRWRRATERAAALGDREAALDLISIGRDADELGREFEGALCELGAKAEGREEKVRRSRAELLNIEGALRDIASAVERAKVALDEVQAG